MDNLPTELFHNIVEFCNSVQTPKSLRLVSSQISDIVNHIIQKISVKDNESFKLMKIINNIRKLKSPSFNQCCYRIEKVNIGENLFLHLGQHYDKILITSKDPYFNFRLNFWVLLDNVKLCLDKCHFIPNKYQLIIHTFSLRSIHSDTYHTEIIVELWPDIKIEERLVKTQPRNWKHFPFCYKCYFAFPDLTPSELPFSDQYKIVKRFPNDVWYTKNKKANLRSIHLFSFEQQTCTTFASTERKNFKFIRVTKFFNDFVLVGIWKRSSRRKYELYQLLSPSDPSHPTIIKKYEIRYKKGGMGMIDYLISINLTTMELIFMSNNNICYKTQLILTNHEPRVQF